jgi:hypothetical protein
LAVEAIISNYVTHNGTILFFHETLVVLAVGSASRERYLLYPAELNHIVIDELASVVSINAKDGERKALLDLSDCRNHTVAAAAEQREALGPSACYISHHKAPQESSGDACAAVGNQVDFEEPHTSIFPLGEGADGNLPFK